VLKRILAVTVVAAGVGYAAYRAWAQLQEENDAWARATDPVEPRDLR
jgi:hypothetical protein